MTIDTSTTNILLGALIALQCWIIRELFKVKAKISIIASACPRLNGNTQFDTDRVNKI